MTELEKTYVFRVAGVDIGIYNMSCSILEITYTRATGIKIKPIVWQNWDLNARCPRLEVLAEIKATETRCCAVISSKGKGHARTEADHVCDKKAAFSHMLTNYYCKTHANQLCKSAPIDAPVSMWQGPTTVPALKQACRALGVVPMPSHKEEFIRALAGRYVFPSSLARSVLAFSKPDSETEDDKKGRRIHKITDKAVKNIKPTLGQLYESLDDFLEKHPEFWTCKAVRLENQGAAFGATTKSVQIMLYTKLRAGFSARDIDAHVSNVNATDKTKDYEGEIKAEKGHKGYDPRKQQAEEMVPNLLRECEPKWMELYEKHSEKADDMADSLLTAYRLAVTILQREGYLMSPRLTATAAAAAVAPPQPKKRKNILPAVVVPVANIDDDVLIV